VRLGGDIERRKGRSEKHGGLSATQLVTYSCHLGYKGLFLGTKIKVGSLVALLRRRTQSEGEMLELLLATHFPNSVVTEETAAHAATHGAK
jgi:hypothetical protein